MAAFRFEAIRADGKTEQGVIDADSPRQARNNLRERGLTPIELTPVQEQQSGRQVLAGKLKTAELSLATRQLASLLAARLPLEQALGAVVEQAERALVRDRFAAVRSEVVGGQSFAQALAKFPRDFPDVYRALVAAGEQSGDLAKVMGRLADYVESRSALSQRILMAFTYPAIVTFVAGATILALLTYVVPQVIGVFTQTKQKLPLLTQMLIAVSDFARSWGWYIAIALMLAIIGFRLMLRTPSIKLAWHAWLLDAPLFGRLIRGMNTARFASTLAILSSSGVPLIKSLDAGARTLSNEALRGNVNDAIARVREGAPLSRALAAGKQFPPMMIHMIASGEATGHLSDMLERTASNLSQETERRALTLTTLLEPALILLMGAVVLVIVLAVLLPIIEINQLVR